MKRFIDFITRIRGKKSSASLAKERLQIIISHERAERIQGRPDYLAKLQQELIATISKYVNINPDDVNVSLDQADGCSVLELNITLPENETAKPVEEPAQAS